MPVSDFSNLTAVPHQVGSAERRSRFGHDGAVLWLTGLSAAGKSTLAMGLERQLHALGYACYTLDGDNVRHGLNANLGFSPEDRCENIRRIGEVAALFADAGLICITAFISPYQRDRAQARAAACRTSFHEIHIAANLATCEARDPKGLYRQARAGTLRNFTGIDAAYEPPASPELFVDTAAETIEQSLRRMVEYVVKNFPLTRGASLPGNP
jgi:adenylyl-sulfate kinase